ncbi:alpha/beta fold hydrolase [Roseomonas mucosa]|uniref:alpha/beta fold hydrolase n=3 Tax=Pseudomonadota TaxID=1224 RepID=UPI00384EDCAD
MEPAPPRPPSSAPAADRNGPEAIRLVLLHFLGGSAREWQEVTRCLGEGVRPLALDLPGFGAAAAEPGYAVADMADRLAGIIAAQLPSCPSGCPPGCPPGRWVLVGHSMGAKLAAVLARRALDGEAGLEGLAGLVLLAGSPPSPEPMAEARREEMLGWFQGPPEERRAQAERFIDNNVVTLPPESRRLAIEDVLRANPAAWRHWLESGSREDWGRRVGILPYPTLILAGGEDADLGPAAQRRLMAPHFPESRLEVLSGLRHLLPLEGPERVAALMRDFLAECAR